MNSCRIRAPLASTSWWASSLDSGAGCNLDINQQHNCRRHICFSRWKGILSNIWLPRFLFTMRSFFFYNFLALCKHFFTSWLIYLRACSFGRIWAISVVGVWLEGLAFRFPFWWELGHSKMTQFGGGSQFWFREGMRKEIIFFSIIII